jgi:multisubunit Na+/H+ antiporter MnhG subunit
MNMNRTRALCLVFAVMLLLAAAAFIGMTTMGVNEGLITATVIVIAALGSHAISRVVMHYPLPEKRQR